MMPLPNSQQPYAEDAEVSQRTQKEQPRIENDFSHEVIGAAVEVQRVLGVGLLESAYAGALSIELAQRGLRFQRKFPVHVARRWIGACCPPGPTSAPSLFV